MIDSGTASIHAKIEVPDIVAAKYTKEEIKNSLSKAMYSGTVIDVHNQVTNSLTISKASNPIAYRYQTTFDNGDLIQDYTVTKIGEHFKIEIHLHSIYRAANPPKLCNRGATCVEIMETMEPIEFLTPLHTTL